MLEILTKMRYNFMQYNKERMEIKCEEVFRMEILLMIVFAFIGMEATVLGTEYMNFPEVGIIVETAVIGGVILWRMRKYHKDKKDKTGKDSEE